MKQGVYDFRIICDICKDFAENQLEQDESQALQAVMDQGWRVKFGIDLCPKHAKETRGMVESDVRKLIKD